MSNTDANTPDPRHRLRLGTRGSALARAQAQLVADELERRHPDVRVEVVICKTTGDRLAGVPLHEIGGKGLFTKELEQALLDGEIDAAVHSMKDVPVTMPLVDQAELVIAAVPARQDPRDALVSRTAWRLDQLPHAAHVGTGSLRRRCQLLALRPDLAVEPLRGNIDTRLRKLYRGEYDAIVLALAGLRRSGLYDRSEMTAISAAQVLPAAGQGALALQARRADVRTCRMLAAMNDPATAACVTLERGVVAALEADCHAPIGALATIASGLVRVRAVIGGRDGQPGVVRADASAPADDAGAALVAVVRSLLDQGAAELLAGETRAVTAVAAAYVAREAYVSRMAAMVKQEARRVTHAG
jgi:hydroxymethylbilane synthase